MQYCSKFFKFLVFFCCLSVLIPLHNKANSKQFVSEEFFNYPLQKSDFTDSLENKQAPVSAFSGYLLDSITFDSFPNHKKRLKKLIIGGSIAYTAAMTGLYFVWYKDGQQTNFHFFDDSGEWRQIDKVGHFYSAFHIARSSAEAFRWAGMQEKKAMFWGAMTGIMLMTPVEILDGFSSEYGASWSDFAANTGGALFAYGQFALWNEIRIHPKFSFHRTSLAAQRPAVLGQGLQEELIKDYNGQTYWLSFDLDKFFPESSRFPKWLNLGLGYGAQDMIYAETQQNEALTGLKSYRQYYLGVDFDLNAIPARRKFWKTTLYILNLIHLPAPALEYNAQNGFKFRPFYF